MNKQNRIVRSVSAAVVVAGLAGVASGQLLNPSFETAGTQGRAFLNWMDFGSNGFNISRATEAVRTGAFSCKMYGQFTGDFNVTGIFQDLPTTRDKVWDASGYFQHLAGDALAGANSVVMNVEFRASNGDLLEYWTVDALTAASPTNEFLQRTVVAVAPDDAVVARLALLFIQPDLDAGAGHMDDVSLVSNSTTNSIINPGFEDFGGFNAAQSARGWGQFPRFAPNIFRNSDIPKSGAFAGFMYGQFTGADNFNGFYQTFDVAAGQRVDAEVFALHKSTDALVGGNFAFINLEFYNSMGVPVGPIISNAGLNSASPTNVYTQLPVSADVPAGATTCRLVIGLFQQGNSGGAVHFDDVTIAIAAPPAFCAGDANGDEFVNFSDITEVLRFFNTTYTPGSAGPGDANNDGIVNFSDITEVLRQFNTACP
ncbi:MAG: dockerin type I domain-containing protein [Planctomycetota bacterium]|nr:dockerin type I domain-containing protein [Planctomycetota bacterium]